MVLENRIPLHVLILIAVFSGSIIGSMIFYGMIEEKLPNYEIMRYDNVDTFNFTYTSKDKYIEIEGPEGGKVRMRVKDWYSVGRTPNLKGITFSDGYSIDLQELCPSEDER